MGGKNSVPISHPNPKQPVPAPLTEEEKLQTNTVQTRNLRGQLLNKMGFVGSGPGQNTIRDFKVPK